jgi:hypothetical protein
MDRGQSTIEVAIVFPVVIIMLWYALGAPLAGLRALAARSAAFAGARVASVEDHPVAETLSCSIAETWTRIGGGGEKRVAVSVLPDRLAVQAGEGGRRLVGIPEFHMQSPREKD